MRLPRRSLRGAIAAMILVGTIIPLAVLQAHKAQNATTILTLAVPPSMKETFGEKLIGQFESAHPGVKINLADDESGFPSASASIDKHLEGVQKYVSAGDVIYVTSYTLSLEGTRAGYFLDLAPLANEDKTLNIADFYPAVWQAFQWDQGIWGLPVTTSVNVLTYQPSAFDKAGVPYPTEKWTMADLDSAVRKLAVKDENGNVIQHGIDVFTGYSDLMLFRSLLGEGLYDANTVPNPPKLAKPGVDAMLDTWYKLDQDGLIGNDFNKAPISISPAFALIVPTGSDSEKRAGVLLPGGKAGLNTSGFAVSQGTQNPDLAYALASFLTSQADIALRTGGTPARQSLADAQLGDSTLQINVPEDVRQLQKLGLDNGFSNGELRYADYVALALNKMKTEKLDAKTALDAAEAQAVHDLQLAADRKGTYTLAISTPVPQAAVPAGKAELKFGLVVFASPLPQQDKWDKLAADFAASDPQVGRVNLVTGFTNFTKIATQNDCFYLPFNNVPNSNLSELLNLDPFLTADTTFDKSDVLSGVMPQLQRDNKTWALPVNIEPSILMYHSDKFSKAGVPAPASGWTVDTFKDALKALKLDPKDPPPFEAPNTGGVHLLMLIAAYGSLPLDYRTNPPTINFTDPATIDAIRQVLDLAKQGYLKYDSLGNIMSMAMGGFGGGGGQTVPIYTETLNLFSFRSTVSAANATGNGTAPGNPYKPTLYPKGTKYAAASYNMGTAYISAKASSPEGCYRWISTLTKHPELFASMPAYRSALGALAQTQGQDIVALYNDFDKALQDPNTLILPSQFSGGESPTGFLLQHWLYQAFDKYVLENKDLESALKDAEVMSKGFQACAVDLPALDMTDTQRQKEYITAFGNCAVKVDPSLKPLFDLIPK